MTLDKYWGRPAVPKQRQNTKVEQPVCLETLPTKPPVPVIPFDSIAFIRRTFGKVIPEPVNSIGKYVRNVPADSLPQDFRAAWGSKVRPGPFQQQLQDAGVGYSPPSEFNDHQWMLSLWSVAEVPPILSETPPAAIVPATRIQTPDLPTARPATCPTCDGTTLDPAIASHLLPYQVPAVKHMVHLLAGGRKGVLDASETGTGKTFVGVATAIALNLKIFLIAPGQALWKWEDVACRHFQRPDLLLGMTTFDLARIGKWIQKRPGKGGYAWRLVTENVKCPYIEVEKQQTGVKKQVVADMETQQIITKEIPKITTTYHYKSLQDVLFVVDEVHKSKNKWSLNARLLFGAARTPGLRFFLASATVAEDPLRFQSIGEALGIYAEQGYYPWARRFGCRTEDIPGRRNKGRKCFVFRGTNKDLALMHDAIFPAYGNRLRKADIPGFPTNQILTCAVDIADNVAIDLNGKWDEYLKHPDIVTSQKIWMESELAKVPSLVAWAKDLEEEGHNIVIFATFIETLTQFGKALKTPVVIKGGQSREEREQLRNQFQDNSQHYALVQVHAGGVSLDLDDQHDNGRPRVAFILPTWSAQDFVQACGRCHRAATKTPVVQYCCYAADVKAEETIRKTLETKIANLDALNDGDLQPANIKE